MLTVAVRLQEMRKTCKLSSHKSHVSRLLFILTRCSRLVLSGGTLCSACLLASMTMPHQAAVATMPTHEVLFGTLSCCCQLCTSRSVAAGLRCSAYSTAEEASPVSNNTAMYGTQPRNRTHQKQRRFSGFPFTSQRPYGGVHKKLGSPRSPIARATTLPTRWLLS